MKKMCLYFLIMLIAAYTTGMHELVKIPAFVSHYKEHIDLKTTKGIVDFIGMHYLGHDSNDNDDTKDNSLPFKNYNHQAHPNLLFIPFNQHYTGLMPLPNAATMATLHPPHTFLQPYPALSLRPPCQL